MKVDRLVDSKPHVNRLDLSASCPAWNLAHVMAAPAHPRPDSPVIDERIQVSFLNVIEEHDIGIRGYATAWHTTTTAYWPAIR